ncbi:MAG: (Fe-S)-binding protein [Candidatus Helarchaeota archaeon]
MEDIERTLAKCTLCKICEKGCSIFLATGKYPPYEKLQMVKELIQSDSTLKPLNWEAVFFCTKCEICEDQCPENLPIIKIIDLGRKLCVDRWGIQYPRQQELIEKILSYGNPFGSSESRIDWLPESLSKSNSKTLVHLGCMFSYPLRSMAKPILEILKKLNLDFTISTNETCCGYFIYNTGDHDTAQKLIAKNRKQFEQFDRIITLCCGCYTFLKAHYALKVPITHVVEVIAREIRRLNLKNTSEKQSIVFQDSCHIARPYRITDIPRKIIRQMGFEVVEFDLPLCCGADGGMRIINPELALKVGEMRLLEAKETAATLTTLCPFCFAHFKDTAEKKNIKIEITSLFELIAKLLIKL